MSTPFHDPASVTIKNLEAAFAGESMAHTKYRYFAKLCRAAGDEATARVFEQTAEQELLHAFGHADLLFPAARMTPARALQLAIEGETYEYTEMYPGFARTARDEGFDDIAEWLETLARAEKSHAGRFTEGLESIS